METEKETRKKELSSIVILVLSLIIIRHITNIMTMINSYSLIGFDIAITSVILSIIMITCIVFILKLKKWAVMVFFFLQGIVSVIYTDLGYREMPDAFLPAVFYCAVLYGLLQIKKNGISGWNLIMN